MLILHYSFFPHLLYGILSWSTTSDRVLAISVTNFTK